MPRKKIKSALISVFYKKNLEQIISSLQQHGVTIFSTGGTQKYIEELGATVSSIEELTGYPSILGGRVKTLHPKVFGGILARRESSKDSNQMEQYDIPPIDLVIVDLYPFEETVNSQADHDEIVDKIDIGGISLIRAAAKNYKDVLIVASSEDYGDLLDLVKEKECSSDLEDRKRFAGRAFDVSSHYDTRIFQYFSNGSGPASFKQSERYSRSLRYGENPHQQGTFFGDLETIFDQLNGKGLSYNNLVDADAAVNLIDEFDQETAFAILKHTNACGVATADTVAAAYGLAFEADTISPFGGVLVTNGEVDSEAAEEIGKLFFEILIAPSFNNTALELLRAKKNRILLKRKYPELGHTQFKSLLNGVIVQDRDSKTDQLEDLEAVTSLQPTERERTSLLFASKICKHTKSNAIVLAKNGQMLASGVGQTSRVDALRQAIQKAETFGLDLKGAAMASDAFFPFPDCIQIAHEAGIISIIQPGGSIKDQDSIDSCNKLGLSMVLTGTRHFKH